MVGPTAINIARLVGRATPAAFKVIEATCTAVERDEAAGGAAIKALRTACNVRKVSKRRRVKR